MTFATDVLHRHADHLSLVDSFVLEGSGLNEVFIVRKMNYELGTPNFSDLSAWRSYYDISVPYLLNFECLTY